LDGAPIDGTQVKYGLSRPDVCAVTASPNCPNVGWNYVADLTLIPNSSTPGGTLVPHTFTLTAIAANGQQYTVSSQFIVNNFAPADLYSGPSITIDIPSATAGTLSGTTAVAGWVIDPSPRFLPCRSQWMVFPSVTFPMGTLVAMLRHLHKRARLSECWV